MMQKYCKNVAKIKGGGWIGNTFQGPKIASTRRYFEKSFFWYFKKFITRRSLCSFLFSKVVGHSSGKGEKSIVLKKQTLVQIIFLNFVVSFRKAIFRSP